MVVEGQRNEGWDAAVAGFAGIAGATLILAVVNLFAPGIPFPPFQLAQDLVDVAPGKVATFFIEQLGHLALPLGVILFSALFVLSGALLGLVIPRLERALRHRTLACFVALLPVWIAWFLLSPSASRSAHLGGYAVSGVIGALTSPLIAAWVRGRLVAAPASEGPDDPSRRYLFRATAAGLGGILLGASGLGKLVRPGADPGTIRLALPDVSPAPSRAAPAAGFAAIPGLTPEVTPVPDFYVVDEAFIDPSLDPATWRLTVNGSVSRPLSLSYAELKAMPAVERYQTLECISNPVGGDLISTALWTGVPLREVLSRAGVSSSAVEIVFRSADGYSDSLPADRAMDPSTLIAIGMGGNALPRAHGYPARVLSLGTYGMKNPKWLVGIEAVDAPYQGFWEQRGWSKSATVKTWSRIDVPASAIQGQAVAVAGVAFAADRGISKVEVSTDGGQTWGQAELEEELSPFTWRRWRFAWTPQGTGSEDVIARAWDGDGDPQPVSDAPPHPSGATGLQTLSVPVSG